MFQGLYLSVNKDDLLFLVQGCTEVLDAYSSSEFFCFTQQILESFN